ncbi:hypothetical protein ACFL54_08215 [Planctomycetota bacterium]
MSPENDLTKVVLLVEPGKFVANTLQKKLQERGIKTHGKHACPIHAGHVAIGW